MKDRAQQRVRHVAAQRSMPRRGIGRHAVCSCLHIRKACQAASSEPRPGSLMHAFMDLPVPVICTKNLYPARL